MLIAIIVAISLYFTLPYALVWSTWAGSGARVFATTSDSPVWNWHFSDTVLSRLPKDAVIVNWSERRLWRANSASARVFNHFLGTRAHTPAVVVFRPWSRAKVFRFYEAYKEHKHGDLAAVDRTASELFEYLASNQRA
jgi:hypothetical protein